jgi:hypothetical protein
MRRRCYFAVTLFAIVYGTSSCARNVEMQLATQRPVATRAATEPVDETLPRHIANPSIKRDERGRIRGLFDVESYTEDAQLCKVKRNVLKLVDIKRTGTVVKDLIFELPSTAYLYLQMDERLQKMYEAERNEFERFFSKGKKFRLTVYECFAPCQNSRDVINIEQL